MRLLLAVLLISTSTMAQKLSVTAHRGASGYAPENTLSAVRKALEIGVDRIEVDVQQTSDGVVICLHDKTLDRTTDSKGKVKRKTWAELQQVKAFGKFQTEFPNEPVPSLEQVFELMDGTTEFVIEIKAGRSTYPGIEDNVVALIRKYKAEKWALVHSFNDRVLEYISDHHPEIRLQKLFVSKPNWLPLMLDFSLHYGALRDYQYVEAFGVSLSGTTKHVVEKAHRMGKMVHVWTVNEEQDMSAMIALGVDGLISNYPDKVKLVVDQK